VADSEKKLVGKIVLVTGGGRGIGRAIALAFAREGADICVAARTETQIQEVAREIEGLGQKALAVVTDVTDKDQVTQLSESVRQKFGRIDILVNNAGGGGESRPVLESDPDLWIGTMSVNLLSTYLVTHSILPLMTDPGGKIINIGSGLMPLDLTCLRQARKCANR